MAADMHASSPPLPTSTLPQLPVSKLRSTSGTPTTSRISAISQATTPATSGLRTPSRVIRPKPHLTLNDASSTQNLPGFQSQIPGSPRIPADNTSPDKSIRRSVSIANFPEPPKAKRPGSNRASGGSMAGSERGVDRDSRANSLRIKKLKTKASTGSLSQAYSAGAAPSLLNGGGSGRSVPGSREMSGGIGSHSPPHSRSSSAQDSYSTSATTLEEHEDKRSPSNDDHRRGRDSGNKGNVIVSVRVRPDASGDKTSAKDWLVDGRQSLISYKGREGGDYYYDNVFAPYDNNEKVYSSIAKRLVHRVMEGYHGTVFAYGMTGTGKTFSMQGTKDSLGVIPSAVRDIFSYIRETPQREFLLRVSYLEIYNEKIYDLLVPPAPSQAGPGAPQTEEIKLREDNKRGVFAFPLKEEIVQSPTQLIRVIARGDSSRKTRSTQFNAQSSRSHAVVQIVVESRERAVGGKANDKRAALVPGGVRVSTLSMIDLAGSERAAESKERRTEGSHINKSLLTLGNVVSRLSGKKDGDGNATDNDGKHLPYRDSKLTRLLQAALSGNSLVSILCTIQLGSAGSVATASGHTGETLNTLKFAARAKNNIVSHAKRAEEAMGTPGDGVLLARLRTEIKDLRSQLESQKKEQDLKVAEEDRDENDLADRQRHEEQILEMHLARTALTRRMEDLKRLIIDSKSSGVNSSGKFSSLSMQPPYASHQKSESSSRTLRSIRSSASHSTLGTATPSLSREVSLRSVATIPARVNDDRNPSPMSSPEMDEEEDDAFGNGTATSDARIQALQSDLADKTRYIATLEKRLLQARRSSQSRTSLLISPRGLGMFEEGSENTRELLKERDAEVAELRAKLEDKDRMINALRSAARNRDNADPASPGPPSPFLSRGTGTVNGDVVSPTPFPPAPAPPPHAAPQPHSEHRSKSSKDSSGSTSSSAATPSAGTRSLVIPPINTTQKPTVSPVTLLSPVARDVNGAALDDKDAKRKSIDEMTKILDGMISDRVQTGNLVVGANGVIKPAHERRKESLGHVPSVGALAAQLRPMSVVSVVSEGNEEAEEGK